MLKNQIVFFIFFTLNIFTMDEGEETVSLDQRIVTIKKHLESYKKELDALKSGHNILSNLDDIEVRYFDCMNKFVKDISPALSSQDEKKLFFRKELEAWTCLCCGCVRMWCFGINTRDSAHEMSANVGKHVEHIAELMQARVNRDKDVNAGVKQIVIKRD